MEKKECLGARRRSVHIVLRLRIFLFESVVLHNAVMVALTSNWHVICLQAQCKQVWIMSTKWTKFPATSVITRPSYAPSGERIWANLSSCCQWSVMLEWHKVVLESMVHEDPRLDRKSFHWAEEKKKLLWQCQVHIFTFDQLAPRRRRPSSVITCMIHRPLVRLKVRWQQQVEDGVTVSALFLTSFCHT